MATLAAVVLEVQAGVPTLPDCREGSEFIANAARSRDNGMPRDTFLARLAEDFAAIRAYPPALRWFVKDLDDERFLLAAVERVYDTPQAPAQHHEAFFVLCLGRQGA